MKEETIESLVRDLTQVGSLSNSEATRRILAFVAQAESCVRAELKEKVARRYQEVPQTPKLDFSDTFLGPKFVLIADAQGYNRALDEVAALLSLKEE